MQFDHGKAVNFHMPEYRYISGERNRRRFNYIMSSWISWHARVFLALFLGLILVLGAISELEATGLSQEDRISAASDAEPDAYDPASILIGLPPDADLHQIEQLLAENHLELVRYWPELQIAHARLRSDIVLAADQSLDDFAHIQRAGLAESPLLRYAEFDGYVHIAAPANTPPPDLEPTPNDPLAPDQYSLDLVRARAAWNITRGAPAVTVAVVDTGYASQHEDFSISSVWRNQAEYEGFPNIDDDANGFIDDIHGWDWFEGNNSPEDANGHGTHIMGTIVATANNSTGVAGLGRAIRVAPLRIFGPSGSGRISDLVAAMDYAVQQEMQILNLSLTTATDNPALRDAVKQAADAGVLVIAAAGNMPIGSSFTAVQYPAAYAGALAVAATDANDERAGFSRYGPSVDIAAPGDRILSTYLNDEYRTISGTSMATAHVSALAALIWSLRPDLTADEVVQFMNATAVDVNAADFPGKDPYLGHGRIDMAAALLEASRALTITTDGSTVTLADSDALAAGELRVRVTAPAPAGSQARLPVHNAVLHYRIHTQPGDPGAPEPAWQRLYTNANGEALIPVLLDTPSQPVDLQVGAVARTVTVTQLPADAELRLTTTTETAVAGGEPVGYTVRLLDGAGEIITASIPVEIVTTLGQLENNAAAMTVNLAAGVYTGTLAPGTVSGVAQLTASAASRTASAQITVLAAAPHAISGPTKIFPEVSVSANEVLLQFFVTDPYGNPVRDGTQIDLYTNAGALSEVTLETQSGHAQVTIKLPSPQTQTVSVWAVVPDGPLEIRVDIPVVRLRAWLPAIHIFSTANATASATP